MSDCGIIAFETLIPPDKLSRLEIAQCSGVDVAELETILPAPSVSVFAPDKADWEYATEAARHLLVQEDVCPSQLGWIIYCGSGVWDKPFWSPAAKVAEQLKAKAAHCFEVVNFCNAGAMGITIAIDRVKASPGKFALVIICDRLSRLIDHNDATLRAYSILATVQRRCLSVQSNLFYDQRFVACRRIPPGATCIRGSIGREGCWRVEIIFVKAY